MKIMLSRIDERLIHGQVMTRWITGLYVTKIILIDDNIARDEFMYEVLLLSAPVGVTVLVLTVEDAYKLLSEDESTEKTLLLFKDIRFVKALSDKGYKVERLNIGNIGSSPVRKGITREVFMSSEEIEIARELSNAGVYVYIQKLPTDKEVDIKTKI
jgi:mannose/fructose/N-acetylgalactosamine-specific phosphotransferase system component IIB